MREEIARELPALCHTFLNKAKDGDLPTMKLLWQMGQLDKQTSGAGEPANDKRFVRQTLAAFRRR